MRYDGFVTLGGSHWKDPGVPKETRSLSWLEKDLGFPSPPKKMCEMARERESVEAVALEID